jgi:hypothetical protein
MDGSETLWCGPDGQWQDVWLAQEPPAAAKVIVYRRNCSRGFSGIALFREYKQTGKDGGLSGMWAKMPANQLAKCAESLALRKAFPNETSGLYTREEMQQADVAEVTVDTAPAEPDRDQLQAMALRRLTDAGLRPDGIRVMLAELGGEGCRALGQLADDKLKRLATAGASAATIERWNTAAAEDDAEVVDDDLPLAWDQEDDAA